MTDRSKLLALAEAVKKLTGPNRATDGMIAKAIGAHPCWATVQKDRQPELFTDGKAGLRAREWLAPRYTASLDAAMTLLPRDMAFLLDWGHYSTEPKGLLFWEAYVQFKDDAVNRGDAEAASPALALTAACLRARAQAEALA